jgi:hypothetical protein
MSIKWIAKKAIKEKGLSTDRFVDGCFPYGEAFVEATRYVEQRVWSVLVDAGVLGLHRIDVGELANGGAQFVKIDPEHCSEDAFPGCSAEQYWVMKQLREAVDKLTDDVPVRCEIKPVLYVRGDYEAVIEAVDFKVSITGCSWWSMQLSYAFDLQEHTDRKANYYANL